MRESVVRQPDRNVARRPRPVVVCPHCRSDFQPQPFTGRIILECEACDQLVSLETDGPTFSTSNIKVSRYRPCVRGPVH